MQLKMQPRDARMLSFWACGARSGTAGVMFRAETASIRLSLRLNLMIRPRRGYNMGFFHTETSDDLSSLLRWDRTR
jgi:hypothetical protein